MAINTNLVKMDNIGKMFSCNNIQHCPTMFHVKETFSRTTKTKLNTRVKHEF